MSCKAKNFSQLISALDQTFRVIFNVRAIGVQANWPHQEPFKCDPEARTSPYLKAHQPEQGSSKRSSNSQTVGKSLAIFGLIHSRFDFHLFFHQLDANEVLERLSVFMLGLTEYLKLMQRSGKFVSVPFIKSKPVDLKFRSAAFDFRSKLEEGEKAFRLPHKDSCQKRPTSETAQQTGSSSASIQNLKATYVDYQLPEQRLNTQSKANRVPTSRVGRIISYGELAAGLGLGALSHLAKRSLGMVDQESDVLLNEANANRIVETLCKVRGAALKIGQLLSIQDSNVISPELQQIFERVRYSADFMPETQLNKVLQSQLGSDWESKFGDFEKVPFAAASIGQVHRAHLLDGTEVAVKIQYPGVADGIESDLKNLVSVLKLWNILPRGLFIETLVDVTRRELAWEVDYKREAEMARQYRELVDQKCVGERIQVPRMYAELSTEKMIVSEMIYGLSIDKLLDNQIHAQIVNEVAERILKLCLREIFEFRFMQTDPNWSNFFYDPKTDVLSLIDFGATRSFGKPFVDKYMKILKGAADKDRKRILKESIAIGFLSGYESKIMKDAHIDSVLILGQIFHQDQEFDFSQQDISEKIHKIVPVMIEHRLVPPPEEIYSLHRKISGIFMLMTKLKAKVNCKRIFDQIYANYKFGGE